MSRWPVRSRRWVAASIAGLALYAPHAAWAQGCAMCQTYLTNAQDPTTQAFNKSILFLIIAPYALLGTFGGWLLFKYWRARVRRPAPQILEFAPMRKETVQ